MRSAEAAVPGGGGPHFGAKFYKSKGNIITLSS